MAYTAKTAADIADQKRRRKELRRYGRQMRPQGQMKMLKVDIRGSRPATIGKNENYN